MKHTPYGLKNNAWWWMGGTALLIMVSLQCLWSDQTKGSFMTGASYDWLHLFQKTPPWEERRHSLVIVYLDLASYTAQSQDPSKAWDRALHARLLDRLTQEGAALVIFDIIFGGAGADPESDQALQHAIEENGHVILAAELNQSSSRIPQRTGVEFSHLLLPYAPFLESSVDWGIAQHVLDEDFTVRSFFPGFPESAKPSMTVAAARQLLSPETIASMPGSAWLRYYGPPLTVPHVSYHEALSEASLQPGFFKDKIVLIGSNPMAGNFGTMNDTFRCPISWGNDSHVMMPGVEVHATQLLNLLEDELLHRLPLWAETALLVLIPIVLVPGMLVFRPMHAAIISVGLEAGLVATVAALFQIDGLWFPWLIIGLVQIPGALGLNVLVRSLDWYIQKKRFEQNKREAEQRIQEQARLIDEAHDAILIVDSERGIRFWSRSATALYGWSEEEALHQDVIQWLTVETDPLLPALLDAWQQEIRWAGTMQHRRKDGTRCFVQCSCSPVRSDPSASLSWVMICTDMTEAKLLENQLQRAQRLGVINSLASGMVHDLNNTLSPILLGIPRLRKQLPPESNPQFLDIMEASTQRGVDMVRQLLAFSRSESSEQEPLDLKVILRDLHQLMKDSFPSSIQMDFILPDDLWWVNSSPTKMHQIILNLCLNARDAMPEGGSLLIACDNIELEQHEASSLNGGREGSFVMILVEDSGTGIPKDQLNEIFDPFFTTKPAGKGTGLGLSSVRSIIEEQQGFIHVRSEPGEGTAFEIYLPMVARPQQETMPDTVPNPSTPADMILLVVDEKSIAEIMAENLRHQDYHVMVAHTGYEALKIAREHPTIRAAIVDLDAPLLHGREVTDPLRNAIPDLPIVFIGGSKMRSSRLPIEDLPRSSFLAKPFKIEALHQHLSRHKS